MVPLPNQETTRTTQETTQETTRTTQETKPKKRKIIIVKKKRVVKKNKPSEPKPTTEELKKEYLQNLDEKERVAMEIAKDHLKTSFDLEKCIDFKNWSSKK